MLELIIVVAVVVLFVAAVRNAKKPPAFKAKPQKSGKAPTNPELRSHKQGLETEQPLLSSRWAAMVEQAETGEDLGFSAWQYDPISDRQRDRLLKEGASKKMLKTCTKGQASDLIGMLECPEPGTVAFLRFFKKWDRSMSQTAALEACRLLWLQPDTKERWEGRPATKTQKLVAKIVGFKLPAKSTEPEAMQAIEDWIGEDDDLEMAWSTAEDIIDEFDDPEARSEAEIKKPSQKALLEAFQQLGVDRLRDGTATMDDIVDLLLANDPKLEKPLDY